MSSFFEAVISFSVLFWIITIDQVFCDGELLSGVSECEKTGRCPTRHGPMTDGNSSKKDNSGKGQRPTMLGPRPGRGFWPATRFNDDLNSLLNEIKSNPWIFISYHNKKHLTQSTSKFEYKQEPKDNLLLKYLMLRNDMNSLIDSQVNTQDRNR
ncbi:hypothetical protein G9C98_006852 [Cotesia typhae]|uniref:Uncharacterized protein n=1 Tax=Cotesia typhae TaxID=2053667 RepID=A0A8J5QZQ6_9HYME|nr:hypothetical protein G9C98_006852 [Cotesia typhae]